jgi:CheY-like chemotaxis protein
MENEHATWAESSALLVGFGWHESLTLDFSASRLMKTQFTEKGTHAGEFPLDGILRFQSSHAGSRTILLISTDKRFHENLRSLANTIGLFVVKAERTSGTMAVLQATRPIAVLLDLDLPQQAAWQTADLVLNQPGCPAVILLSGRTAQFDMRTAMRAGSLVSKKEPPDRLLGIIQERLKLPVGNEAERNAIQRVLIRWLRPSGWAESTTPAYRFWGINE